MWTRPLRKLTPETSYGYRVIWFAAAVLQQPLDPWQQWLAIHLGELLPDGRPRFRRVLVLVARQNGKTHLCKVLALFWMFVEKWPMIFGTSTNLDYAAESWQACVDTAQENETLTRLLPRNAVRLANGQQTLRTTDRCRYKIGAVNPKGGRSLSIDRIVGDELREHHSWAGYRASYNAMNARPAGQAVYISNMGDARSVVLNSLRKTALAFAKWWDEHGDEQRALELAGAPDGHEPSWLTGEYRIGLFEWSAPAGSHPMDVDAWAAANPQLGRGRLDYSTIRADAVAVAAPGADQEQLTGFLTEVLCIDVPTLDPAIAPAAWAACRDVGTLDSARSRLAACVDVAPDLQHASLAVAGILEDGRARVEIVQSWDGATAVDQLRDALPALVARINPRTLGWFPGGPAAVLDTDLRDRRKAGRYGWPPRGTTVAEMTVETAAVCMGFAEQVDAGRVAQSGQALLDQQVEQSQKLRTGARWVFTRLGAGHCDAVYAGAGAVHLARTLPTRREVSGDVVVAP